MTLKEVFNKVMVALDEAETTSLEQNMTDYKLKIYECVDSCQRELAAFVFDILKEKPIEVLDDIGILPEDCFEIKGLYLNGKRTKFEKVTNNTIKTDNGVYKLRYSGYPQKITSETDLGYELEISAEACEALIYGVCGGLCINDEPELYSTYMDRYNGLCQSIIEKKEKYPKAMVTGGITL